MPDRATEIRTLEIQTAANIRGGNIGGAALATSRVLLPSYQYPVVAAARTAPHVPRTVDTTGCSLAQQIAHQLYYPIRLSPTHDGLLPLMLRCISSGGCQNGAYDAQLTIW
ncbi:unnamed protein product, partial [Iphiclides podalirius]